MGDLEHKVIPIEDVHPFAHNSETDPGAVGFNQGWFNPATGLMQLRNAADDGWDLVSSIPVFPLAAFGAMEGEDATDPLSDALDAVGDAGGGAIIFPRGETLIDEGGIVKNFSGMKGSVILMGAGANSRLKIRGNTTNKIEINNTLSVTVKDLLILGSLYADIPNHFYRKLFAFGFCDRVHFENVIFAGIRMANGDSPSSGAIYAYNCNLSLDRVIAGGCAAPTKGFVTCEHWLSLMVKNSQFLDYIQLDGNPEWTLVNSPYGWIYTHAPLQEVDDDDVVFGSRTRIHLENVDFDEGATYAVVVAGDGAGGKTASVIIENCSDNSGTSGGGFNLADVKYAHIKQTIVGLAESGEIPGIIANNVDFLKLEGFTNEVNVNHIHLLGNPGIVELGGGNSLNGSGTYPDGIRNEAGSYIRTSPGQTVFNVFKTGDTNRALTTTRTVDTHLKFDGSDIRHPLVEPGTYLIHGILHVGMDTPGMDMDFQGTAVVSSFMAQYLRTHDSGAWPTGARKTSATSAYSDAGGGFDGIVRIDGVVTFSAGGTFGLCWSQQTSSATGSIIFHGSSLQLTKI
ncbi:MAG TPA: hypothetical protein VGC76_14470 [Pyrinomonadaceae bacterium]|jgi:hypothetical protein